MFGLPAGAAGANLRALRERDWTYAVYFGIDGSGIEYELYDLATDPLQMKKSTARLAVWGGTVGMGAVA